MNEESLWIRLTRIIAMATLLIAARCGVEKDRNNVWDETLRRIKMDDGAGEMTAVYGSGVISGSEDMAAQPLVSVVIPTFNRWGMVSAAIESARAQSYANLEIIVVDDGSTDPVPDDFGGHGDKRVTVLRRPDNRGAAAARNAGIDSARGGFIAFLDSDDSWAPDKIERQVAFMNGGATRQIDVCCTGFYYKRLGRGAELDIRSAGNHTSPRDLLNGCFISPGSTLMARRNFLIDLGSQNEDLDRFEDWEWLLRAARRSDIAMMPESLAHVAPSHMPQFQSVIKAGQMLKHLQGRDVFKQHSMFGLLRFLASIDLECSLSALKTGRMGWFVFYGLRALVRNPMRVFQFMGLALVCRVNFGRVPIKSCFA
jgi:hypothetical protein